MNKFQIKNSPVQTRAQEARIDAFALKIRQYLQAGSEQLDGDVPAQLKAARERALDRQKKEQDVLVLAQAPVYQGTDILTISPSWWKKGLGWTLPALILFFALFGANQWQEAQRIDELAEIDALILSDDLPLYAHLDPGFVAKLQSVE